VAGAGTPLGDRTDMVYMNTNILEDVWLVNLDHRQLAPFGAQRVSLPGEFFFMRQQFPAGS
jgi:hypothetical protein